MAIDPRISLSYVPPQIDWSQVDPFARQQKQLTLQGLMEQQTLRQLQIQQERMQLEQARKAQDVQNQLNAELTRGSYGGAPAVQPSPEAQRPIPPEAYLYEEPNLMRPAGPEGRGPGTAFAPAGMQTQPVTQFAQVGMPSTGSPFGGVDPGALIRKFGTFALPIVQKIYESQDAALKRQKTQQDVAIGTADATARTLNGIVDETSFKQRLPSLAQNGVSSDEIRQYMALGYDDPRTQNWMKGLKGQSVNYLQSVDVQEKIAKAARDQFADDKTNFPGEVNSLTDVKDFPALLATKSPAMQRYYGGLTGITDLEKLKQAVGVASVKPEVGTTVPYPASVQQQKIDVAASQQLGAAQIKQGLEDARNRQTANAVVANPKVWNTLSESEQKDIRPLLPPALLPNLGKQLSEKELDAVQQRSNATKFVNDLQNIVTNQKHLFGPFEGLKAKFPYAEEHQKANATIELADQVIGKWLESGILRAEDVPKYHRMLPKLTDTPGVAQHKANMLQQYFEQDWNAYQKRLAATGRQVPEEAKPETKIDLKPVTVTDPRGGVHTFPSLKEAEAFKKAAGIK